MKLSEINLDLAKRMTGCHHPSVGGDPEFFVANRKGKILNSDKFFPSKHEPSIIMGKVGRESGIFFDGIQAELAIAHNTCRDYFIENTQACLKYVTSTIPTDHRIILKPSVRVQKNIIDEADSEAKIFGCMPDFNAYTQATNTEEMDASRHPFRYAGGHMHFGASSPYLEEGHPEFELIKREENHLRIIKFFDLIITIPTLLLDNGPGAKRRRNKYGKAGCFRPTPYGVEYRTPSCWWLQSPITTSLVFGLGKLAWSLLLTDIDKEFREAIEPDEQVVRGIIDESDVDRSYKMWKKMRPYLAISSRTRVSPVSLGSMYNSSGMYWEPERYLADPSYKLPTQMPDLKGGSIFSLAVFEYMLKNGLHSNISKKIKEEWLLGEYSSVQFKGARGFIHGNYLKLRENKDFLKFQDSFLNELF